MKHWSLSQKIWSILGLLIFAFVGSTYYSITRIMALRDSLERLTTVDVERDQTTSAIVGDQRSLHIRVLDSIVIKDPELLKKNGEEYKAFAQAQQENFKHYEEIASEEGREVFAKYKTLYTSFLQTMDEVRKDSSENRNEEAIATYLSAFDEIEGMREKIVELNALTEARLKEVAEESKAMAHTALLFGIAIALSSIVLATAISFFVLRQLNATISNIVKSLADSSVQVSSAAGQIASSSEELSQATTEQAASLEETASSIEELNSMVSKNSENANSTAQISTSSQEKATEGKRVVETMIQSMKLIDQSNANIMTQVNQSNENMADIVKVIEEIGNKTKVINDIVFQTKLLSFNAPVEAARAGEHGKGFAVVAEEVGNLAEMSGNAAKEITAMLEGSVNKVNSIVAETKSSVEKLVSEGKGIVENGARVAHQCGEVLEDIVKNVNTVSSRAEEIATASEEQSRGVSEITKAMAQLDQVTQQNASVSEEAASAAEELSAQSESLKITVQSLVETVNGTKGAANTFTHSPSTSTQSRNVLPMKKTKPSPIASQSSSQPVPMKKAAGGVPSYDHEGFEEV